jgi:hypothetical protein
MDCSTLASAATGTTGTKIPGVTAVTVAASTSQFDNANTLSFNNVPDVIAKLAFEPEIGGARPLHFEVYGRRPPGVQPGQVTLERTLSGPEHLRGHCQTKFYTATLEVGRDIVVVEFVGKCEI